MTADEVKEYHDRIWAVRKKIKLRKIIIDKTAGSFSAKVRYFIIIDFRKGTRNIYKSFLTISSVNQFLKELG